ncbi:MAG: trypsin-like peptidase domain-containing protein [Burkholderiaceae bacterium]|nr:trypsin-like peptidase domain-containing protein [Burkholderiaceae bacterium]
MMSTYSFRGRLIAGAAAMIALAGCATTGAPGGGAAGPGAAGTAGPPAGTVPPGVGSLADPQVRQRLTADLSSKGWRVIGTTSNAAPDAEPNVVYAHLPSASSSGQLVRVWTVTILSDRRAQTERAAAIGVQSEYDCARNQVRPIGRATYSDRLISERRNFAQVTSPVPNPITQGTVAAQVHSLICASRPSSGSGVVLSAGRVLTNAHVVAGCTQLQVVQDGQRHTARAIAQDARNDLALLEAAPVAPRGRGALALRRSPVTGESIMVAGFPLAGLLGNDIVVTTGIVNSLAGIGNDPGQIQVSAPVQPGNSGGPLLDKSGNLVGLVVSKLNALRAAARMGGDIAQNVNFAIKPEVVRLFLDVNGLTMRPADPGVRLETEDLAVRARDVTVKIECVGMRPSTALGAASGSGG